VIVVDADLRQCNCHILLGLQDHAGLTNIFLEDLALEECLQATTVAGLSLLSRGATPANPADLLGSPKMKEILQSLRERFDIILIDSPPAIAVSDAAILSAECDGVLLVLYAHKTTTEEARDMVERLEMVGARLIGAVLNGIDIRSPDFANYRHYYRSYYGARGREKRS
jgi:capsular exopolysaccharide synthesis family protein